MNCKKLITSLLLSLILIFVISCGSSTPESVGTLETEKIDLLTKYAPQEIDITNNIQEYIAEQEGSESINLSPKRDASVSSVDPYFYALSPQASNYVENELANITYNFMFQRLDSEGNVTSDLSGTVTYKYVWNSVEGTWEMQTSTKKDKNPYFILTTNNALVRGLVYSSVMNLPVTDANVFVSSNAHGFRPFSPNTKGLFIARVLAPEAETFEVVVSAKGYQPYTKSIELDGTDRYKRSINLGKISLLPDLTENMYSTVKGQVKHNGLVVPNVSVVLSRSDDPNDETAYVSHVGGAITDSEGNYQLNHVPQGIYYMFFMSENFAPTMNYLNIYSDDIYVVNVSSLSAKTELKLSFGNVTTDSVTVSFSYANPNMSKYKFYIDGVYNSEIIYASSITKTVSGLTSNKVSNIKVIGVDYYGNEIASGFGFIQPKNPEAAWTVMIYMMADNNLSIYGTGYNTLIGDIDELEMLNHTSDVNYIVEIDTRGAYGGKRYYIQSDSDPYEITSPVIADFSEINSADVNHATNFFDWAIRTYPASHYAVLLWDHGAGWKGGANTAPNRAIGTDDGAKGYMISNIETGKMLADLKATAGKNIDLLAYQACLMQMAEIAYEVKDSVDYHVSSEESMYGTALQHDKIWSTLMSNPGGVLTQSICDEFMSYMDGSVRTLSSIKSADWGTFNTQLNILANALIAGMDDYYNHIYKAWYYSQKFSGDVTIRDLYSFCENLQSINGVDNIPVGETLGGNIIDASINLRNLINTGTLVTGNAIATNSLTGQPYNPGAHGISIYMPYPKGSELYLWWNSYSSQKFAIDTDWDEFLRVWHNKYHPTLYNIPAPY